MSQQNPKHYDFLSHREMQLKVSSGDTLTNCPSNVMFDGDEFTVEHVQGYAQGDKQVTFITSDEGSSVRAPRVIGETALGWVDGSDITLDRLGKSGHVNSTTSLDINIVEGMVTAKSATVGVIQEDAWVNVIGGDLKATKGIFGRADARSIHTPVIGARAEVNARHGLVRCDQIDGKARGRNALVGTISRGAHVEALEELTVGRLEGQAEAQRVAITGEIVGTRFVDKTAWEAINNLEPMAPHDVYTDFHGMATAEVFDLKGVWGDIDFGRLHTLFRKRKVWSDKMKRPHGTRSIKTQDLFVRLREQDGREVFFETCFEVRDLATGKVKGTITILGETV